MNRSVMSREAIVNEIVRLAHLLAAPSSATENVGTGAAKLPGKNLKGVMGSLQMLIDEGYLDHLKPVGDIMGRLKEIGHHHNQNAVAMNLLNLTKRRTLNRFRDKELGVWKYVLRR